MRLEFLQLSVVLDMKRWHPRNLNRSPRKINLAAAFLKRGKD